MSKVLRYLFFIIGCFVCGIALIKGIIWLPFWLVGLYLLWVVFYSNQIWAVRMRKYLWLLRVFAVLIILGYTISVRLLFFEVFRIPSGSMENTLKVDDVILVNKFAYGARLPYSPFEIPWVNIACYFNENARSRMGKKWWSYNRLNGLRSVKRNDIVVFNLPLNEKTFIIKRCVAIAGDTLLLRNGRLTINHQQMVPPSTVKQFYQLFPFSNNQEKIKALLLKNKISENLTHSGQIMLTSVQANTLSQCSELDSITVVIDSRKEKGIGGIDNTKLHWTFSNYGEYIVPYKGMQITLNDTTIDCYKEIMIRDEKLKWNNRMKYFEVNSNPISNYTFRHNYYFMMGDNRNYSIDSRGWGVVADHHIIGKASLVLYSQKAGVFMKRLLKPINTH